MTRVIEKRAEIAQKNIEIVEIKDGEKLGVETTAVSMKDISAMFSAKSALEHMKAMVANGNKFGSLLQDYYGIDRNLSGKFIDAVKSGDDAIELAKKFEIDHVDPSIIEIAGVCLEEKAAFAKYRRKTEKIIGEHSLMKIICEIKGVTPYSAGIIMAMVKTPCRFDKPSSLLVYAGLSAIWDEKKQRYWAVTKANINHIRIAYKEQFGKEFKGFNTELSGRLIGQMAPNLIRAKGFFYNFYLRVKERVSAKAKNSGRVDADGYMKGKNKQSLKLWSHANAVRRMMTVFLVIFYQEWSKIEGHEPRDLYVVEYLAHTGIITLDEILTAEKK